MKGLKTVERSLRERLEGGRPSRIRASMSAAVAGGAVAFGVYKALRS